MAGVVRTFLLREAPSMDDVRSRLWSAGVTEESYSGAGEKYRAAILEQYRIYVEMADRITARRGLTNTFFLGLNTGMLAGYAALAPTQCLAWSWIMEQGFRVPLPSPTSPPLS